MKLTRPWVSSSTMRKEFAGLDTTEKLHCSYLAHKATTKAFQCFSLNFNFIFKVVSSSLSISNLMDWNILGFGSSPHSSPPCSLFFLADAPSILSSSDAESKHFGFLILFKMPRSLQL